MKSALYKMQGVTLATLLDDPRESANGTWFESVAEAYRQQNNFAQLVSLVQLLRVVC